MTWAPVNHDAFMAGFAVAEHIGVTILAFLIGVALIRALLRAAGW